MNALPRTLLTQHGTSTLWRLTLDFNCLIAAESNRFKQLGIEHGFLFMLKQIL
ncbi:hypothetical protein FHX60_000089 [Cupriavidus alkaliphilus]|nr:hypothetical protein [Cupriavidus alkaliphilus]